MSVTRGITEITEREAAEAAVKLLQSRVFYGQADERGHFSVFVPLLGQFVEGDAQPHATIVVTLDDVAACVTSAP